MLPRVNTTLLYICIGICYRILGRLDEAEAQFKSSSAKNPSYLAATYNLGMYSITYSNSSGNICTNMFILYLIYYH